MELVVLIGLQASGKSSFYQARFANSHHCVSKDQMPNAKRRDAKQLRLLHEHLARGESVVVDNTNPSRMDRAPLIALGQSFQASVTGFYFESRVQDCLERNRARVGRARVPDVGLFATIKKLEPPAWDEGFDALWHVRWEGTDAVVSPWQEVNP